MKPIRLLTCASALLMIAACEKSAPPEAIASPAVSLDAWFTPEAPAEATAIHLVRESAKPGAEITIQGLVMGRMKPFVDGRAAFVLGDDAILTPCHLKPGDQCETPWDVCCDTPEAKRKGTATIQIVGEDGRVLTESLRGQHGLTELSAVTVRGQVAEGSSEDALIVNATAIHVHP